MTTKDPLSEVDAFWKTQACGTHFVQDFTDEADFYEKFREQRYRTEWHIPLLVPFANTKGQTVLEIGTGNGADAAMFAINGAVYTGVDLTETALEATRKHFAVLGLSGTFQQENAEALSFPDESFDWVYSHGVLHHTPNPKQAINEVWRVLKPNGKAIIMLYHKKSFNYFVRIMTYMRGRVLLKVLARFRSWKRDRAAIQTHAITGVRGNQDSEIWEVHYRNFLKTGWSYFKPDNFIHHCTDGPECPIAFAFTKADARRLFARFRDVTMRIAHFPLQRYNRRIPFAFEKLLSRKIGWYLFVFATK